MATALGSVLRGAGVTRAWLVGGAVRDGALGRLGDTPDWDVAVPGDGAAPARAVASRLGGSAFPLDEDDGAWRVALAAGGTVDVIPLRAPTVEGDLAGRDFTVNAVAIDLTSGEVADPLNGLGDLEWGILRPCAPDALDADPVRVLRAYRFAVGLGLTWAPGLEAALGAAAPGLARVARERVRTEWFAILGLPGGGGALRTMAIHGVLGALFPFLGSWEGFDQGSYHHHDLLEHSLRVAEALEGLAADPDRFPGPLEDHLSEALEQGVTRKALLVCSGLFHDMAKPETATTEGARRRFTGHDTRGGYLLRKLLERFRVGRKARGTAQRVVAAHLRLFQLAHQDPPTERARLKYLRDLGDETPEALLLSVADEQSTGPEPPALGAVERAAREILALHWSRRDEGAPAPLIRGRDLLDDLGLLPGPRIGVLLAEIAEAEADGRVTTRHEALAWVRRYLDDPREKGETMNPRRLRCRSR